MVIKLFTAIMALLVLGDALSTYLLLAQVPGGREVNPFMVQLINLLGPALGLTVSALFRFGALAWFYYVSTLKERYKVMVQYALTVAILLTATANANNWALIIANTP